MAQVVLFHSVLGLRPGIVEFAQQLRKAGHTVITPDFYDGAMFEDYEAGNKKWSDITIPGILNLARAACKDIQGNIVFAGFSNGAAVAEILAATDRRAIGAILMHGALPLEMAQLSTWPAHVPVQLHYQTDDPFRVPENDASLQQSVQAGGADFTEYLYPGTTHLFADPSLPDYNKDNASRMLARVLAYLQAIDTDSVATLPKA